MEDIEDNDDMGASTPSDAEPVNSESNKDALAQSAEAATYQVGNKRPPKHSQWQPGQCGNPKGRPKGSLNLATRVQRELRKRVLVSEGVKKVMMAKADVFARKLVDGSLNGDIKSAGLMLSLSREAVRFRRIGIQNDVSNFVPCLVVLSCDVYRMSRENLVELSKHAGQVALDLDEARSKRSGGQLRLREVHCAHRRSVVTIFD
jgi:hypothetical protein